MVMKAANLLLLERGPEAPKVALPELSGRGPAADSNSPPGAKNSFCVRPKEKRYAG